MRGRRDAKGFRLSAFAAYARYYDLLYSDKDYNAEAAYIKRLLAEFAPDARSILDIGCGTGTHARGLAESGYCVHGVDISGAMLERATQMQQTLDPQLAARLEFTQGDARDFDLGKKFPVVVSLFHVMSYQTSNDDLLAAFASARRHLVTGGIFIFDCWYGPGVLTDRPRVVRKTYADEEVTLDRLAEPLMDAEANTVRVDYTLTVSDESASRKTIRESHMLRYLFTPEVQMILATNNLTLVSSREWMTDKAPGFDSWNVCYVARA
jgi:SAM-dependent methyltransferase